MSKLKVYIKGSESNLKLPTGLKLLVRRCCTAVLAVEKFNKPSEVSVTFMSDNEIRNLNKIYRSKNEATDVLSFPLTEDGKYEKNMETGMIMLGDIVISIETAYKQADIYDHSIEREIGFLTVHSMLHLLGYDHEKGTLNERVMREKEEAILEKLGISRVQTFKMTQGYDG